MLAEFDLATQSQELFESFDPLARLQDVESFRRPEKKKKNVCRLWMVQKYSDVFDGPMGAKF